MSHVKPVYQRSTIMKYTLSQVLGKDIRVLKDQEVQQSVIILFCGLGRGLIAHLDSSLPGQNGRHFADDIFR